MKKSFLLMRDLLNPVGLMTDEESGRLFKAIISYFDGEQPDLPRELQFAFLSIQSQLDRDDETYQNICERNRINGLKGGRPKTQKTQVVNLGTQRNPEKPRKADTDTDTDTDTEKIKASPKENPVYPNWLDQESWGEWKQHRVEIRKPMTALAETKGINKLKTMLNGVTQRQVIDHCIANGYQGLFAPDQKTSVKSKTTQFKENLINA